MRFDFHHSPDSSWVRVSVSALIAVVTLACPNVDKDEASHPADSQADATTVSDFQQLDIESWVAIYDPERASAGYTLDLYKRRVPILFDMNGRVVHAWPTARVRSRARLLTDGSLLAIGLGRTIDQYDWDGKLTWQVKLEGKLPHHDVIRISNGNTVTITATRKVPTDTIVEIDPSGNVVWEWDAAEHLAYYWVDQTINQIDTTHINSVQEIPSNPWFELEDNRFRPGNLLISARNLDALFIIDKVSKQIVWTYNHRLDRQHEALMIGPGLPGHGNILVFNNGSKNQYLTRRSTVIEIDPLDLSTLWEYRSDTFLSQTGGVEQPLPNGNVMITSSLGKRIFEVTREGDTVWEWTPSYKPKRPNRYPLDYCPQLDSIGRPRAAPVAPPSDYRYVDAPLFQFGRRSSTHKVTVWNRKVKVLEMGSTCRELMIPVGAELRLIFGLNEAAVQEAGLTEYTGNFRATLRPTETQAEVVLLDEAVSLDAQRFRRRVIDLGAYRYQRVELCLDAETYGLWHNPQIRTQQGQNTTETDEVELFGGLTEEELRVRREHLEALGYID